MSLERDVLMRHIRGESDRFAAVLAGAHPAARVRSCPDWSALDLAWHLAEVHHQWAVVVGDRLAAPDDAAEASEPTFEVTGSAEALAGWLWRRPGYGDVTHSGDESHWRVFEAKVADGIP